VSEPDIFKIDAGPIRFGQNFVSSEAFKALFQEGMELIEETAAYLDGPGRADSRQMLRESSIAYASESMRLTTRLMQIASWLLLQRAVAEGELTPDQAHIEKNRVRLTVQETPTTIAEFEVLPSRLKDLIGFAARLHARITHLERLISESDIVPPVVGSNPVAVQQGMLEKIFGARKD
jgi:regulator of CtrA degradation